MIQLSIHFDLMGQMWPISISNVNDSAPLHKLNRHTYVYIVPGLHHHHN